MCLPIQIFSIISQPAICGSKNCSTIVRMARHYDLFDYYAKVKSSKRFNEQKEKPSFHFSRYYNISQSYSYSTN